MQFCQDHWDRLRAKIAERGLSTLVCEDGNEAVAKSAAQLNGAPLTVDNFEPLMGAMWAIVANLMDTFGVVVMMDPGCPLCSANQAHRDQCQAPECAAGEFAFDYMLDRAADDQVTAWQELRS